MSDASPQGPAPPMPEDDQTAERRLDEEEVESFPASDPHSDWAGPPEPIE